MTRWTEADYESLSWHDNAVHGLELGDESLVLHLDYILEWLPPGPDGRYSFRVAPAVLRFRDVSALTVDLDYIGRGVTPFTISVIGRTETAWTIGINWPEGVISFQATGFVQELVGEPVVTDRGMLPRPL